MVRELEIRAHGGAEEHSGRARVNPANELNRRFLRSMNVLLSAAALSGPAAVAGVAAGTVVISQAREAKAQLDGIQPVSLDELQDAIRRGRSMSAGFETYRDGSFTTGAVALVQNHRIEIAVVVDESNPADGYGIQITRPDGSTEGREFPMARLRDLYRQATGEELRFVAIGADIQDTPDGYVEFYVIPVATRGGPVQSGVPFRVAGFELDTGEISRGEYRTR